MSGCLREFQPGMVLDDVKDLIDREIQVGEGDGVLGLCRRWGIVLLGSFGSVPTCTFPRVIGLKALGVIMRDGRFGAYLV